MSVWTTSTTGLETALAAAIGSTLQQHTNTITNNLKGQPHILHIGNSVGTASVASNLHHLNHHNSSSNNNININHLQHHLHHGSSPHHSYNSKHSKWHPIRRRNFNFLFYPFAAHNNIQQSNHNHNRSTGICSNHSKVSVHSIMLIHRQFYYSPDICRSLFLPRSLYPPVSCCHCSKLNKFLSHFFDLSPHTFFVFT